MTEADETITVDSSDGSLRLDRWFKRHYPGLGHGQLEKLLRSGYQAVVAFAMRGRM